MRTRLSYRGGWIIIWGILAHVWAKASPDSLHTVFLEASFTKMEIDACLEAFVDSSDTMLLADARNVSSTRYVPIDSLVMPLPLTHRLWVRLSVVNPYDHRAAVYFYTGNSDSMALYVIRKGEEVTPMITGNYVSVKDRVRSIGSPDGFPIGLDAYDTVELYLLMTEIVGVGPKLYRPAFYDYYRWMNHYYQNTYQHHLLLAIFIGGVLIILAYNLVVFFATGLRTYLYYALYLFSLLVALYYQTLIGNFPHLAFGNFHLNRALGIAGMNGAALFYLLFGRSFVDAKRITPVWDRVLGWLTTSRLALLLICLPAIGFGFQEDVVTGITIYWAGVESVVLLVYFVRLSKTRATVPLFFIVGSILVFGGGFMPIIVVNALDLSLSIEEFLLPAFTLEILVFSLGLGYRMRQQQRDQLRAEQALNRELKKVNSAFGRFVPHEFIQSLGHQSVVDVKLGDQVEKEVTVLFTDIRGYTALAEQMTPSENFRFLNAYLGRLGPIIQVHNGFVNQYYGDGIMALFLHEPADALRAAVGMLRVLALYNEERQAKGRSPIQIGIGIHTGPLMMGIIGDTLRMEAGVVADTVNTASRMEGLTKHFGVNLILSEATFQRIKASERQRDTDTEKHRGNGQAVAGRKAPVHSSIGRTKERKMDFGMRMLGDVLVKGSNQPLRVYECYDGDEPAQQDQKASIAQDFEAGLVAYFQGDFARALHNWRLVEQRIPSDPPTAHYVSLAETYLLDGPPQPWDGVEVMLLK